MRSLLVPALVTLLVTPLVACSGDDGGGSFDKPVCGDGQDNDADGTTDFPDDLGCDSENDDTEDSLPNPQCKDGRDNDGDGKKDFPSDPGCFAPQQDDEADDCPDGPGCPQCSNMIDDDENGQTDWPNDTLGCTAASDTDEYTQNPVACGSNVQIKKLPFDGHATGTLPSQGASNLMSATCGGAGLEEVYELRVQRPKVIVATSDNEMTAANTVMYIRDKDCVNMTSELVCNDDISTTNTHSAVTKSISTPGTYYLVVDSKDATGGTYDVQVRFLTGEGEMCSGADDCGPGLVCRIPGGGTQKVCSKHVCEDTIDDDMDGKIGYPTDPGCSSAIDEDESDSCPGVGPNCPECGDGVDNDGDGKTDFGATGDVTCKSAGDASEACLSQEGVSALTTAMTMGDTSMGALHDVVHSCGSGSSLAPDRTYRLDLPAMAQLTLNMTASFDTVTALYNSTCGGTSVACSDPLNMTVNNLAAGTYYFVVDGYYTTSKGTYTIAVGGKIQNGQSCESTLAKAGAITCNLGYACKGTMGSRTCQPALCSDGVDNDADGKIDYPNDPGCLDTADDTEQNPTIAPVCADGMDNDGDSLTDFPADYGCAAASGTSEVFCTGEMDATAAITTKTTTGTTMGAANDWAPSCSSFSTASDKVFALQLPVPVQTLTVDTIGSGFDTVLAIRTAQCAAEITGGCNDDGGGGLTSKIDLSNVMPGNYAIVVDGYNSNNGAFTLNVRGTVAAQTACSSTLFSGGANAVLVCPTGTTCTGSPLKCQ
jgi:large repetitive protein